MNWTFNENPPEDGYYVLAQHSVYDPRWMVYIGSMPYTIEGGWNTYYADGKLRKEYAIEVNDGMYSDGFAWVPYEELKEFILADIKGNEMKSKTIQCFSCNRELKVEYLKGEGDELEG